MPGRKAAEAPSEWRHLTSWRKHSSLISDLLNVKDFRQCVKLDILLTRRIRFHLDLMQSHRMTDRSWRKSQIRRTSDSVRRRNLCRGVVHKRIPLCPLQSTLLHFEAQAAPFLEVLKLPNAPNILRQMAINQSKKTHQIYLMAQYSLWSSCLCEDVKFLMREDMTIGQTRFKQYTNCCGY